MYTQDEILTVDEVSKYLKRSKSMIYWFTARKRIPCFKVGKRLRFRKCAIDKWAEEQRYYRNSEEKISEHHNKNIN